MKNNRGQMSVFLFLIILFAFIGVIFIAVAGIVVYKIDISLDQNISIGKVNLQTINDQTFGILATTFLNNADWWGIALIFGMIFGLFISSYFIRNTYPKLGIILDVFIIIIAFILSIYVSSTFNLLVNSLGDAGETFIEDYMGKSAMFLLNLPIFTVIIGVIVMVLFHSSIPKKTEERYQQGGYLQGI